MTSMVPISLCKNITKIPLTKNAAIAILSRLLCSEKFLTTPLKAWARKITITNFKISEGWKDSGPKATQRVAPFLLTLKPGMSSNIAVNDAATKRAGIYFCHLL